MVIYEVNLAVDADIAEVYEAWLHEHVRDMLAIDGFWKVDWFDRRREDEAEAGLDQVLWTMQYHVQSRKALDNYFEHHAAKMRGDGMQRFAGQFSATRRILHPHTRTEAI